VASYGGSLPLIDSIICRIYPRLFLETKTNSSEEESGGAGAVSKKTLSELEEEDTRKIFEKRRQLAMEKAADACEKECIKEVDDMGPDAWKKMMSCSDVSDIYSKLGGDDKREVENWMEKRTTLIHDMQQKEVAAILECDDSLDRSSKPFIRMSVRILRRNEKEGCTSSRNGIAVKNAGREQKTEVEDIDAILTIWEPSEEQINLFKEGQGIRIKNATVRGRFHHDAGQQQQQQLQLSATNRTHIQPLLMKKPSIRTLTLSGYIPRTLMSFIDVHLLARKKQQQVYNKPSSTPLLEIIDVVGFAFLITSRQHQLQKKQLKDLTTSLIKTYLTDESGLVIRLEQEIDEFTGDTAATPRKFPMIQENAPALFRDIAIVAFDTLENCAVAVWTQKSSMGRIRTTNVMPTEHSKRIQMLKKWSESKETSILFSKLRNALDAGVFIMGHRPPPDILIAVGHISFRNSTTNSTSSTTMGHFSHGPSSFVAISIDTGKEILDAIVSSQILSNDVNFNLDGEKSKIIGNDDDRALMRTYFDQLKQRVSGSIYHFIMKRSTNLTSSCTIEHESYKNNMIFDHWEVVRLQKANITALARLHILE